MNARRKIGIAVLSVGVIGASFVSLSNPLRRSDESVREWLLESVPVGSSEETLMAVAEQKGWTVNSVWDGYSLHSDWGGIDGSRVAWIYLGGYRNLFRTDLDSFWAFDESGRLMDVKTRRMTDAL